MFRDCKSMERLLIDDLDDALNSTNGVILANHLADCPACRECKAQLLKGYAAISALSCQRESLVPVGMNAAIKDRLVNHRPEFKRRVWQYASAMTMVILLIVVVFVYQNVIMNGRQISKAMIPTLAMISEGVKTYGAAPSDVAESAADSAAQPTTQAAANAAAMLPGTDVGKLTSTGGYSLYSGSLAGLKPLQTAIDQQITSVPPTSAFRAALPGILANAQNLRILTNTSGSNSQVIILAGYDEKTALDSLNRLESFLKTDIQPVEIKLIVPSSHFKLIDLFGQNFYDQMLPTQKERLLTYLLISFGG